MNPEQKEPYVVRRYPVTGAKMQNPTSYLITRLSHQLKIKHEQYKTNLSIEQVERKVEEDPAKKDRIDKAKYSGKVTSTDMKRDNRTKSLKGMEFKLTQNNEEQTSTLYGSLVEGQKSKHMLLFVRGSGGGHSIQMTAVPAAGWMHFQKDIEELRNKKDPFLKMTKEQQKAYIMKQKSTLNMLTEILESDDEAEENPKSVKKIEKGLKPLSIFKPRNQRTEDDTVEGPRVLSEEMVDFANKISVRAKQMRKAKQKEQNKAEEQKQEDDDEDAESSQDSAYDNYFGRIAEKRGKDREGLDFDEEFSNDEEEDMLFMNDDEYVRDLDPAVIKGGKQKRNIQSSKSRKLISRYEKDEDEEEEEEEDEEEPGDEGSQFSNEWPSSQEPNRARLLGSRKEPEYAPEYQASEKRGVMSKVKLTEHLLIEQLRKEAKFEIADFCATLERRYEVGDHKEFNVRQIQSEQKMMRRLANIDEGKWLILKEQYRPTYSKSTLLFEKGNAK